MVFAGMLPRFLSSILSEASNSLVDNANLIGKDDFGHRAVPVARDRLRCTERSLTDLIWSVMSGQSDVLLVLAHPNDEIFVSGAICLCTEKGFKMALACATDGDAGEPELLPSANRAVDRAVPTAIDPHARPVRRLWASSNGSRLCDECSATGGVFALGFFVLWPSEARFLFLAI
jgi:hypothetical protein